MDFKPKDDLLPKPGSSLPKGKLEVIKNMLANGKTIQETSTLAACRKQTVVSIRKEMELEGKLELGSWKKELGNLLGSFAVKGAQRLNNEIDTMPIGQVMMAVAIAVDKVRDLSDAPIVKVEARLKISQDDLNAAFMPSSEQLKIIDLPNENPVDNEPKSDNTSNPNAETKNETTIHKEGNS